MKRVLFALSIATLGLVVWASAATAALSLSVTPWTYSHGANSGEGVFGNPPVTSKCTAAGLTLIKTGATSDDSAAGATIGGVAGIALTELGFDLAAGGVYEDGPRFNVVTSDEEPGTYHAYNITYSASPVAGAPAGYQRYRMDLAKSGIDTSSTGGKTVVSINVVFDNHGEVTLKNFDVNGVLANCVPTAVATASPSVAATAAPTAAATTAPRLATTGGGGIPLLPFGVGVALLLAGLAGVAMRRRVKA
jgi:hypothetical protein